jgi:peptide/nickel transport system permease protein
MLAYAVRRILISIPVIIASTMLTFVLVKLSGDPLDSLKTRNPPVPQHTIDLERHRLWLDRSWPAQYWHWISDVVLHGNFGETLNPGENVRHELFSALWVTTRLVVCAVLISLVLAVITGVYSAVHQYSATDYTSSFFGFLFLSMPVFWFAVLLKQGGIWYNQNVSHSTTFYTIGDKSVFLTDNSWQAHLKDIGGHMVLPVIVLSLTSYAAWSRFTRASMLEVLDTDYVRLARAKGLSSRRVLIKHALRNALIPLVTVTSLDVAALLGGAIIVETVFQWHGMGYLFLTALGTINASVMLAWLSVTAFIVIIFNLLADILYGVLDPRIRYA